MTPRSLALFKKNKGIHLTIDQWIGLGLSALLFFLGYLSQYHGVDFNGWFNIILILWFLYGVALVISNFFRYEAENGKYNGYLEFHHSNIRLNNQTYDLPEILNLDFQQTSDVRGKFVNAMLEFTPHLSNGLDNKLVITFKDGKVLKYHFLQTETEQVKHFKELLVHYYLNGLIRWLQLIEVLEIEDYSEIQKFKKEVNNYGQQRVMPNS